MAVIPFRKPHDPWAFESARPAATLSARIVEEVREALFAKRLAPGDFLGTEKDLAEQAGVSRIVARDALRTLQALGVVEIKVGAGGGARIAKGNPALFADYSDPDVIRVDASQSASSALAYMQAHDLRTAPVVDDEGRVVGMVRRAELLAARDRPVGSVLDPFVHKVMPSTAIEALLPILSSGAAHEAMVVDENRVLVGIITQTDLLAVLYRAHVVEAVVDGRLAA